MSSRTTIALLLAIALSPAAAMAASKHQAPRQVGPAVEQQGVTAYGYSQTPPSVTEPTYMMIQDQSMGTGE
jgi:hypothetical protein